MRAHTTAGELMMFSAAKMLPDNRATMAMHVDEGVAFDG
jgi:hypothetical protein